MPLGKIRLQTRVKSKVEQGVETHWRAFQVKPGLLKNGKNVVAAEVHQADTTSSDLSFDLRLTGIRKLRR